LIKLFPAFFFIPGEGDNLLQPIWIDDLIQSLRLLQQDPKTVNRNYSLGGMETLSYRRILELILEKTGKKRWIVSVTPAYLRTFSLWVTQLYPKFPVSIFWLDHLAEDRTTSLDSLPRQFGIMPNRFHLNLDYLKEI
jgi:NADH dehydrogenase